MKAKCKITEYTGLYVQRLSNGIIISVQVKDPYGNETYLSPEEYARRDVLPSLYSLPDKDTYEKKK